MIAFALPGQVVFNGVVLGLTYGVLAIGVILVFRSSRVINFAIAEMGAFGAVLLARLVVNWNVPFLVAFVACIAVGGLIGAAVELGVVRRLFEAPRVILLVATIGVARCSCSPSSHSPTSMPTPTTRRPSSSRGTWATSSCGVRRSSCSS
jgi:branched-subunit amino acid ABC-type transport system permease component